MFDDDTVSVCTCAIALWSLKSLVTEHTYTEVQDRLDLDYPSIVWSRSRMQERILSRYSSLLFHSELKILFFVLSLFLKQSLLTCPIFPLIHIFWISFYPFLWIKSCFSLPTCWIKITFFLVCSCWELLGVVGSSNQNLHFRSTVYLFQDSKTMLSFSIYIRPSEHPNDQGLSDGGMSQGCLEQGWKSSWGHTAEQIRSIKTKS